MKEFKINEYITLKLEEVEPDIYKTNIYVNDELFLQCKYILLEIPKNEVDSFNEVNSIDDLQLDRSLENGRKKHAFILPETEFWAHCSNLQVWAEHKYDTRLLHSNLAFPLLKQLIEVGDPNAKKVFKDEIAKRFINGSENIQRYLASERYLKYFIWDEKEIFFKHGAKEIQELERLIKEEIEITDNIDLCVSAIELVNGEVVALKFSGEKLDHFPEQVRRLRSLKKLDIYLFTLDNLPDWLGECTSLEHLKLTSNHFKKLPETIGNLRKLKSLNFSRNELETLPNSIGDLSTLEELDINHNLLHSIPESIGRLPSLKKLSIGNNKLQSLPETLSNLVSLEELFISNNLLKLVPKWLAKLPSIKYITLGENPIEELPPFLTTLPSLKTIELTNIPLTRDIQARFERRKIEIRTYEKKNLS